MARPESYIKRSIKSLPIIQFTVDNQGLDQINQLRKHDSLSQLSVNDLVFGNFFLNDIYANNKTFSYQNSFLDSADAVLGIFKSQRPDLLTRMKDMPRPSKIAFIQILRNYFKNGFVFLDEIPKEQKDLHKYLKMIKDDQSRPGYYKVKDGFSIDRGGFNNGAVGTFKAIENVWKTLYPKG